MATIEDTIREVRGAIAQVQTRKARAAVELENATSRVADARTALKDEFGVTTTDEARLKLQELQADLDAAVAEVENALAEAGA